MDEIVFVLGTSRSGTSAVARTLSLCGGTLPERLIPENYGNPTGYWEPADALELNSQFLRAHGSNWFDPTLRLIDSYDVTNPTHEAFVTAIAAFLEAAPYGPLIIKEPRISTLTAFWFAAAERLEKRVKCVVCVRSAPDVAASLYRRDAMPAAAADVLWLKYTLLSERASRSMTRAFVSYDALVNDWRSEMDRISRELAIDFAPESPEDVDRFLFRRSDDTTREPQRSPRPWIDAVYERLRRASEGADVDTALLDAAFDALQTAQNLEIHVPSEAERALPDWETKANWEETAIRIALALPPQELEERAIPQGGQELAAPPVVYVTRGTRVESVHAVAACAAEARGRVVAAYGTIDVPVFLRSSAKPFIAAEIVASGAADRYGFDARELAVIAASHNGEPFHIAAVESILAKIGLDVSALRCGASAPAYEPAAAALAADGVVPTAIHNNCSGKHAGILALCLHAGYPIETYLEPSNPAQQRILAFCGRMSDDDPAAWDIGIDGCGIPVYATSLRRAATAFARFASLENVSDADAAALERVRAAMIAEPAYVAGTGRFDTALMEATHGKIACKAGAEAVHASAVLPLGIGCVLKVVDGGRRAAPPAQIATLRAVGALDDVELRALATFARPEVFNVAGRSVGVLDVRLPDTISGESA